MNDSTKQYISRRIADLGAQNVSLSIDLEIAHMKVKEIESRIACHEVIIEGLKHVLEEAK